MNDEIVSFGNGFVNASTYSFGCGIMNVAIVSFGYRIRMLDFTFYIYIQKVNIAHCVNHVRRTNTSCYFENFSKQSFH